MKHATWKVCNDAVCDICDRPGFSRWERVALMVCVTLSGLMVLGLLFLGGALWLGEGSL